MQLSEHFTLEEATYSETAIRMGIPNQPSTLQLENMKHAAEGLEKVRALLGKPMHVNSWLRLPDVNVAVGGSKISSHMDGWAIDFTSAGFGTPYEVCKAIEKAGIKFDQMIHEFARWNSHQFRQNARTDSYNLQATKQVRQRNLDC
jgi:putative chitinase